MKRMLAAVAFSLLASLIVLPVTGFVHNSTATTLVADGSPIPIPLPPPHALAV